MIAVLAVTIFSLTERGKADRKDISDYLNFILVVLALVVDSVALAAVIFQDILLWNHAKQDGGFWV